MKTNIDDIYAAGDIVEFPLFTAEDQQVNVQQSLFSCFSETSTIVLYFAILTQYLNLSTAINKQSFIVYTTFQIALWFFYINYIRRVSRYQREVIRIRISKAVTKVNCNKYIF
jgi:threonine/homoserine/homoserine lactone efflux protein